jgi:hypothetical protein
MAIDGGPVRSATDSYEESMDICRVTTTADPHQPVAFRRSCPGTRRENLPDTGEPYEHWVQPLFLKEYLMRRLFHAFAPVVAAAALALAGASSALAAGAASSASLDANFCYPSGATTFCYDIDGSIHFVDATAGSSRTGSRSAARPAPKSAAASSRPMAPSSSARSSTRGRRSTTSPAPIVSSPAWSTTRPSSSRA